LHSGQHEDNKTGKFLMRVEKLIMVIFD